MYLPLVLATTGVLTIGMGAMYYAVQKSYKPGLGFYTSPGTGQIILAILIGGFTAHWAIGVVAFILLTYLFICSLKWGGMI